jgi:hypothetical protein
MPWKTVRMSGSRGNIARFNDVTPPWYLAGGLTESDWLGLWQPKGAASYAASKISLVNPSASNLLVDGAAFPTWDTGIGWTFVDGLSQYLTIASAITDITPVSMICRFNADTNTTAYVLMSICRTAVQDDYWALEARGDQLGDPIWVFAAHGVGVAFAKTSTAFSAGNWFTATGVFLASNNRNAYIDGGSKGNNTTIEAISVLDTTYIGIVYGGGVLALPFDGKISACGFVNKALSDAQVLAIHNAMVAAGL